MVVSLIRPFCYGVRRRTRTVTPHCFEPPIKNVQGRCDYSLMFSVSAVQTLENEIRFDINFTCRTIRATEGSVYFVLNDKFGAYI